MVPFGPWAPDADDFASNVTPDLNNVFPGPGGVYLPWPSFVARTDAVPAQVLGACLALTKTGFTAFAGTANKLYKLNAGTGAWEDVSQSMKTYTATETQPWRFAVYNDSVVAVNNATDPQYFTPGTSSAFADVSNAPRGSLVGVWGDHLIIAGSTSDPRTINASDINDFTVWAPLASNNAFQQEFSDGGAIVGFSSSTNPIIIQLNAITRGTLVGAPAQITFTKLTNDMGSRHPDSMVHYGNEIFFWSTAGFARVSLSGGMANIGENRVNRWMAENCDLSRRIKGWADIAGRRVFWAFYATVASSTLDRVVCYDIATDQWTKASIDLSELVNVVVSAQALDDISGSLDAILETLDKSADAYLPGAFDTDYKAGTFTGPALAATLESSEFPKTGRARSRLNWAMPAVDTDDVTVTVLKRERRGTPFSTGTASAPQRHGLCQLRDTGRFFRLRSAIASSAVWTKASGVEIDYESEGLQ